MYNVYRKRLIDNLMAQAVVCGDITRRGRMLVDNDDAALSVIADTVVAGTLAELGVTFRCTPSGWRIDTDKYRKHRLEHYLSAMLLSHIAGTQPPPPPPTVTTVPTMPLEGYFA